MTKKNLLIVSHSLDEAITQSVQSNLSSFESKISIVSLYELIHDYEIFDEISDCGSVIRWYKGNDLCISNTDHLLLNRVLGVQTALFANFIESDQEYAQRELEAYLGFAFNSFTGIGNKSAKGAPADILSLPQQWSRIQNQFNLNIPNYYWGPHFLNSLENMNSLVYSDIYNFLNWSPHKVIPEHEHIFCFEKPPGEPVFILSIGTSQLLTSKVFLPLAIKNKIQEISVNINNYFKYFISEILLFINDENMIFGCINHEIIRSVQNKNFDQFICENLLSEFYKCLN